FSLTGTRDGGHSSIQNPSITSHKSSSPIYIKEVNQTPQHAIIDTGSAGIIIHQQLLKIHHKKFIYKRKIHASASCTSVNIIGEIHLEIKIQGHKTWIVADVATNLVTDLLLGTDWIKQNRVIIDSPQQRVNLVNKCHKIIAYTPFVEPPDIRFPVFLIALPSYSEQCIDKPNNQTKYRVEKDLFSNGTHSTLRVYNTQGKRKVLYRIQSENYDNFFTARVYDMRNTKNDKELLEKNMVSVIEADEMRSVFAKHKWEHCQFKFKRTEKDDDWIYGSVTHGQIIHEHRFNVSYSQNENLLIQLKPSKPTGKVFTG
ncbi:unnamed protein product, partial [Didymodactylos carnosus]